MPRLTNIGLTYTGNARRGVSETSDRSMDSATRQIVLNGIRGNTRAVLFNGGSATAYKRWKSSLDIETKGLDLSPEEWFQILKLRTSGEAANLISSA